MDSFVAWCDPGARLFDHSAIPDTQHFADTFVAPFYLNVLHGNYVRLLLASEDSDFRQSFIRKVNTVLKIVDTEIVDRLFEEKNWRVRLVAAWLCGIKGWHQYANLIGSRLVPSEQCYAGQAYCFALARFADEASARHLCRYLDEYLPQPDKQYDQYWAMPALIWIDKIRGTAYSKPYIQPDGLWDEFLAGLKHGKRSLMDCQLRFERLMEATTTFFKPEQEMR
jgi:hypothetical protein